MKKITKSIITSSLLAVAFGALSVGSTFALFTSQSKTEVTVGSGIVNVESKATLVNYSSSVDGTDHDFEATETSYSNPLVGNRFELEGSIVSIDKMVPGDVLTLKLSAINKSNVKTKTRLVINHATVGTKKDLYPALDLGFSVPNDGNPANLFKWTTHDAVAAENMAEGVELYEDLTVTIAFPDGDDGKILFGSENHDNQYQDAACSIAFSLQAVQGNAATSPIDEINAYLEVEKMLGHENFTMHDAVLDMAAIGYTDLSVLEGYVYDLANDQFVKESSVTANKVDYFKVCSSMPNPQDFSIYAVGDGWTTVEGLTVGFDAGDTNISEISYDRSGVEESQGQAVVIRTNGGTLTINAPYDTIQHYGEADIVNLTAVGNSSYYENGSVSLVDVKKGRLVITNEEEASVGTIYLSATGDAYDEIILATQSNAELPGVVARESVSLPTSGKKLVVTIQQVDQNGTADQAQTEQIFLYPESDVKEEEKGYDVSDLGLLVVEALSEEGQAQAAEQLADKGTEVVEAVKEEKTAKIEDVILSNVLFNGGKGTQEKPYLISTAQHWNNMYVSLHEQAISETQLKLYFKLVNDIDFTNVALDTVHINNDKVTFSLDGNNHKVSGIHDFTGERYVFYKIKDTDIKNITLSYNGENTWMGLSYSTYGGVTRITGVTTEGTIYATGGWLCSFITYPYGTMGATGEDAYVYYKNCVNKTDHLGNAEYAAPFGAHAMTVKQISFENCSNTGTIAGQHASGFIGMTGGRTTQFEFVGENPAVNRGTIKTTSSNIANARNFSTDEKKSGDNYKVTVNGTDYIVNGSGATLSSVATLNVTVASEMNGDITISNIEDAEYYYVELTIARQGYNFNDGSLKNVWGGSLGSAELDFVVEKSNSDKTKLPFGKIYVCESNKDRVDWRNRDSVVDYKGLYYSEFNPEQGEVVVADDYKEIICYQYDGKTFLYIDDYDRFGALTQDNQNGTKLNLTVSFAVYAYDANDILVGQKTVSYTININDAYNFFNGEENHFAN